MIELISYILVLLLFISLGYLLYEQWKGKKTTSIANSGAKPLGIAKQESFEENLPEPVPIIQNGANEEKQANAVLDNEQMQLDLEVVYGEAIVSLSQAFALIHALKKKNEQLKSKELKVVLSLFCDLIAEIYRKKTKSLCSVSIKVVPTPYANFTDISSMEVKNIARDSKSKQRDTQDYEETQHLILENTCYQIIIAGFKEKNETMRSDSANRTDELYFLCNDLPALQFYLNSSFKVRGKLTDKAKTNGELRRKEWSLGYRSELVVALSPIDLRNVSDMPVIGFICVDCEQENKGSFDMKYDVPLLRGVADGIYDIVKSTLISSNEQKQQDKIYSDKIDTINILFFSSSFEQRPNAKADKEQRKIKETIESSTNRDKIFLYPEVDVTRGRISKTLQQHNPNILHFSGHGDGDRGLMISKDDGGYEYLTTSELDDLFTAFREEANCIECVLMNACYTTAQAEAISKHGIYVVGMNDAIGVEAAIDFSKAFYRSIGEGKNFKLAFAMGKFEMAPNKNDVETVELWFNGKKIK